MDSSFHQVVRTSAGPVVIRAVRPDDKPAYPPALREFSAGSLYRRFMSPRNRFSEAELAYATEVDWKGHVALVGVSKADTPGHRPRGVADARWIRYAHRPDAAEVGVFVGDRFQGLGLGRTMLGLLILAARERGVRFLCGEMWRENTSAFALMDRCGYPVDWALVGAVAYFEADLMDQQPGTGPVR